MSARTRAIRSVTLIVTLGCSLFAVQTASGQVRTGVFAGPVIGLKYETPTGAGVTNAKGEFQYRDGEEVAFSLGGFVLGVAKGLGSAKGTDRVNLAQLISRVNGDINKLKDPLLTNLARLLQTLDQDGNVENGVTIAPQTHELVGSRFFDFSQTEEAFSEDRAIATLLLQLDRARGVFTANTPRKLRTPEAARNEVRRNIRGIIKMTDVKIPTRDGAYLLADVFRPDDGEKHAVVLSLSIYGKAFIRECICNPEEAQYREVLEDQWFSGNAPGLLYENHETPNTAEWVPKGYVVVRVDARGVCTTPGTIDILSLQEAKDHYDAIEWAGTQPWSNGNVGTWGMSYDAMDQHNVAWLQPPHLKAMIPIGTDIITFDDSLFNGGLFNEEFWTDWWYNFASHAVCGELKFNDFIATAKTTSFYDPALYGPEGSSWISPDMSKVNQPQWIVMPTTHQSHIHQRASSEAYIRSATPLKNKKLKIAEDWFLDAYASTADWMAFFDYWLKGVKNGIMDEPPVRAFIRTGNGAGYWQYENEWPIARTKHTKFYLDASPSSWAGDGRRRDFLRLSQSAPSTEKRASYSAEVPPGAIYRPPLERFKVPQGRGTACWATGVSFVTDPVPEDMVLAGYMKLGAWASSTSHDMDVYVAVRVMDDKNQEMNFSGPPLLFPGFTTLASLMDPTNVFPVGWGLLKVSHRKLDPKESTDWRPIHTHLKADYAPLKKGEIVPVEIEVWPNTAVVKKGHRIRLDIQPYGSCGGSRHSYDPSYHDGAENTIYTGPTHPSYLQLPVIPAGGTAVSRAAQ